MKQIMFQKMRARAIVCNFFLVTTKRCAKESSLSWQKSELKYKSMKYEKSEKQTSEISNWVKNL